MTTNILLVRHGQTAANVEALYSGWSGVDLSDVGHMQARRLSDKLASVPMKAIYSSPLRRTLTTAVTLAEPHGLEVSTVRDLIEINLGDWEGLYSHEIRQRWPDLWKQSQIDPSDLALPNGETFSQVAERAVRAFEEVVAASEGSHAVIVTHDAVVRILAAHVLGVPNSIYRRLEIENASLTWIRIADGRRQLVSLNDTSHLAGLPMVDTSRDR